MRAIALFFFLFPTFLFSIQTDFDVTIVGSSPIALLEAIYCMHKNQKVLIIEANLHLGGAWKSIDVCGVANVDLGCHLIGSDPKIKSFFEEHFKCQFVCLDHPSFEFSGTHISCGNGYYFSQGCFEMISSLRRVIDAFDNGMIIHEKLDSIYVDAERRSIDLFFGDHQLTTSKLIITPTNDFSVRNLGFSHYQSSHDFHHLYLLIEDPNPPRFTYVNGFLPGLNRAMNLTPFLSIKQEGMQLIALQTSGVVVGDEVEKLLQAFKDKGLLASHATVVAMQTQTYCQIRSNRASLLQFGGDLIEILDTSSFRAMARRLEKWKAVIPKKVEESVELKQFVASVSTQND